ncbi:hypothetical protein GTQ43_34615 [Nostoc sp. KVJ3]|uniref:diaminopimelate decarboxylase family protein n=1 Tax=Nostoc sp. KVJ3 TaxID=457945 RepID=UPI0022382196|nr:hypothetical protein [Nostoc sp. KVJ3]MCW5318634.1 hypothetical protein [Nostoc sp. KVJ3]
MTEISIDSLLVKEIAEKYGTPTHILNLSQLKSNYTKIAGFLEKFLGNTSIFYSFKTNYLPLVCRRMLSYGAGADVVSGYEMESALDLGFNGKNIIFNGPMKTYEELEKAEENNILVNIDGIIEIEQLQEIAKKKGKIINVGLRINPNYNVYPSVDPTYNTLMDKMVSRSKFGWNVNSEDAYKIASLIKQNENLRLSAIQCHVGSQVTNTNAFFSAIDKVLSFIKELISDFPIETFNFGGGMGVDGIYRDRSGPLKSLLELHQLEVVEESPDSFDFEKFIDLLSKALERKGLIDLKLACEPGRSIVSNSMFLITRIASIKKTSYGDWLILDAGLNLLPTAGIHEKHNIVSFAKKNSPLKNYMVAGPLCYEGDVFSYSTLLPEDLEEGDLLGIFDTGAYTVSRATNFIRPKAPVVAVEDSHYELCWKRETFDDIFSFYQATSFEI